MKVYDILRETTEQEIAQAAKGMVAKAKAGDIGGAADDMERVHNSIARMDIGSGLYDFMQRTLKQLKALVASNPNHPEAPKFVQAIKDIEAGLPAMKQAAADSRRMAVDAGAGRQDVAVEAGLAETTTSGATSVGGGNIASVSNPSVTRNSKKPKKRKGVAPNALDSNTSLMSGQVLKR